MEKTLIQPLIAALISSLIAIRAYRRKSLDLSGALAGFIVMTVHIAVGYRSAFHSNLFIFFKLDSVCLLGKEKKMLMNEYFLGTELCCLCSFLLRLSSPRLAKRKSDASMLISRKAAKEIGINLRCLLFFFFNYYLFRTFILDSHITCFDLK
jgi:hypothetical protein